MKEGGSPQTEKLLLLMWSLIVDNLLKKLHDEECNVQRNANKLDVVIKAKHDKILAKLMQMAINFVSDWCFK